MTRRLIIAIVATVVATLVVAGLGTLALTARAAKDSSEKDLRAETTQLASAVAENAHPLQFLLNLRKALRIEGAGVVQLARPARAELPDGITLEDILVDRLREGSVVSGRRGGLVFAAAPAATTRGDFAVVLTRRPSSSFRPAAGWFLRSSIAALLLAGLVAVTLSRRLTKPLREATEATRRIANGELSTRIPVPRRARSDELVELTHSINTMVATLQRSQTLEQRFLLSVSHDLRTPLTSIRGYAEAIADGAAPDDKAAARVILSESGRLERLVRDLLDLAKLEQREFTFYPRPVDLASVLERTASGFVPDAARRGVTVQVSAPVPVVVTADPDRLAQVVANLTENALKYAHSLVNVTAVSMNGAGLLTVDDDGPGIEPDDLPHVFERLYKSPHAPTRREVGSGLGLAIVRELVVGMGGQVAAGVAPGGGARVTVSLPLAVR